MTHFTLREWTMADLPALVEHANDPTVADNLTDAFPHPYTVEHGKAFLARFMGQDPQLVLAIDVDGAAVGAVGIHPQSDVYRRNAELGYWIAKAFRGKGIMTEAVKQATTRAFDILPDIHRVFARPYGSNTASQRVLEKAGFILEARMHGTFLKNGRVEDELIYAIRR
ncbi:MAG TPA: GNAT family N-acetyltransferase [Flavobacteriales bacterium]|jgi:ribosomal-protein-alanine N-acetyltransferase|nr:GNAT family N-acetyltransferase [Flavobacteriales bacterium]MBK6551847.1 GNAT family N-acetyltransferase [Flavobacteriales bacterium]MBK7112116.1 GNAT family N-acetyltransferase [Flavobacteriales bacterium]MBK7481878.1 GNAT family N-acetyltransferase [Flavobacteriales bacterium]MBK7618861.1 GNAT family N-acetyltransferase [Flavobacteriales bacterium]